MITGVKIKAWIVVFILTLSSSCAWAESDIAWPNEDECLSNSEHSVETQGWCLVLDRSKGNCLACHAVNIEPWPMALPLGGNIGPPLIKIQKRFSDIASLRAAIEDSTVNNPKSSMPPYLKHGILTAGEINLVVQFLWSI